MTGVAPSGDCDGGAWTVGVDIRLLKDADCLSKGAEAGSLANRFRMSFGVSSGDETGDPGGLTIRPLD